MFSSRKIDCQVVTLTTIPTISGILYWVTRLLQADFDQRVFENNITDVHCIPE